MSDVDILLVCYVLMSEIYSLNGMPAVQFNKPTKKAILSKHLRNRRFPFADKAERGVELVQANST